VAALLAGKVAIVTGGGGGIGRGISLRFADEGAAVVIAEIDTERARETQLAITGQGGRAVSVVADVRDAGLDESAAIVGAQVGGQHLDLDTEGRGKFRGLGIEPRLVSSY